MNRINYICRNGQMYILQKTKKITLGSKAFINKRNKKLDVKSESSKFFGVDSRMNILQQLMNHLKLIDLKYKNDGIMKALIRRVYFSVDKPQTFSKVRNYIWEERNGSIFEQLFERPARLTFAGKFFGNEGAENSHTIGILYDKKSKTLFCQDSLPNFIKEVKEYQNVLKRYIFKSPNKEIKKIIFSNKHQQNYNEYTCNNWAIANIEALQRALKEGKPINNTRELNAVLPDNINKILQEQYNYVLANS